MVAVTTALRVEIESPGDALVRTEDPPTHACDVIIEQEVDKRLRALRNCPHAREAGSTPEPRSPRAREEPPETRDRWEAAMGSPSRRIESVALVHPRFIPAVHANHADRGPVSPARFIDSPRSFNKKGPAPTEGAGHSQGERRLLVIREPAGRLAFPFLTGPGIYVWKAIARRMPFAAGLHRSVHGDSPQAEPMPLVAPSRDGASGIIDFFLNGHGPRFAASNMISPALKLCRRLRSRADASLTATDVVK
jgi:hypothetical protein